MNDAGAVGGITSDAAFGGHDASAARWFAAQPGWWHDHYIVAVDAIADFLAGDGLSIVGRDVLDLGCGDGIIAQGMFQRLGPRSIAGVDLVDVDRDFLDRLAIDNGIEPLTSADPVRFARSTETGLPAGDRSFDVVVAWSVFEHVADIASLLCEVERVLRPGGLVFLCIWPLWYSEHGSHLWPWFDTPFAHLEMSDDELSDQLRQRTGDAELAQAMLELRRSCNAATVDDLQSAIVDAGLYLAKVELQTGAIHLSPALQRIPVSQLAIAGVKMLAVTQKS